MCVRCKRAGFHAPYTHLAGFLFHSANPLPGEHRLRPEEVPAQFATATPPALAPNASFSELLANNPL